MSVEQQIEKAILVTGDSDLAPRAMTFTLDAQTQIVAGHFKPQASQGSTNHRKNGWQPSRRKQRRASRVTFVAHINKPK